MVELEELDGGSRCHSGDTGRCLGNGNLVCISWLTNNNLTNNNLTASSATAEDGTYWILIILLKPKYF